MHRKKRQQDKNKTDYSGKNHAWIAELAPQRQQTNGKQDGGEIRVHQPGEDSLSYAQVEHPYRLAGYMKDLFRAVKTSDVFSVNLFEQVIFIVGNAVNQMIRESFIGGKGLGLPHSGFGHLGIAASLCGIGAQQGC